MASDSNLTTYQGNSGFGQKVFPIPFLNAALTYTGLYEIQGIDLDVLMTEYIANEVFITTTIEEFVSILTTRLNADFRGLPNDSAIIHVCGYSRIEYQSFLEHWHISNVNLDTTTGNYTNRGYFDFANDFNTNTNITDRESLQIMDDHPDKHRFYINGFPPARISMLAIKRDLERVLNQISNQENWSFRPPKNIFESANKLKQYYKLIEEMFKMSDYEALFVGGETQTYLIPAPPDLNKEV